MLRDRVRPLFYTRLRLGEFDPPAMNPYNALELSVVQSSEHRNLSLEAAIKSFVLLKNQRDTLPLRELHGKRLAVRAGLLHSSASPPWHGAVGACLHPSPLRRWWVPLRTTPVCCLGTTRQCQSHSISTHHGEPPSVLSPGSASGTLCPSALPWGDGELSPWCADPVVPHAGGGCRHCQPTSALLRAAGSRGAGCTHGMRWRTRCGELMWCWCAWGRVGGSTGHGCCHVGARGDGVQWGVPWLPPHRDRCGDGGEGPQGPVPAWTSAAAAAGCCACR